MGNPVCTAKLSDELARQFLDEFFAPYSWCCVRSGTMALELAIRDFLSARAGTEVLLPAYGCPDLVSAVIGAGATPVLVDTKPDSWGYDFDALKASLGPESSALVAVDLFGLGDQAQSLRELLASTRIPIIQDSAQSLQDPPEYIADFVVLSLGRGKPVNLLGGGVLLWKARAGGFSCADIDRPSWSRLLQEASLPIAGRLANLAMHPRRYHRLVKLFGARIGRTVYIPPRDVEAAGDRFFRSVAAAIKEYCARQITPLRVVDDFVRGFPDLVAPLVSRRSIDTGRRLLRYPLLARTKEIRKELLSELAGRLGASPMYHMPLNELDTVPEVVSKQGPFPGARSFADRLLTLPLHPNVGSHHIREMEDKFRRVSARY